MEVAAQNIRFSHAEFNVVGRDQHIHRFSTKVFMNLEEKTLAALKPANRSGYAIPRCMEGTREWLLKSIHHWLDDLDADSSPNIMWISGSPGSGKSAISSSLVSSLTRLGRLGAFFPFKRGEAELGDPTALWRTVAFDLVKFHPSINTSIIEFLSRPGFRDSDISLQFEYLIEDALRENAEVLALCPPVIVVDALDECDWDGSHSDQRRCLLETIDRWQTLPRFFKIIVTSRNDRIPNSFRNPQICRKVTLETGDSVTYETQNDIRIFFTRRLENVRSLHRLPSTWPGGNLIDQMTARAAGLFIWAQTAVNFMEGRWGDPTAKLDLVLAGNLGKKNENIDTLYQQVLDFNFEDADDGALELFRRVVGTIIVAKMPLSASDLKHFLEQRHVVDEWRFNAILGCLSSVIDPDGPLCLGHLSFAEFLSDRDRCPQQRFFVDLGRHHENLALACLQIMNEELRFNICQLETSHRRNDDVDDLITRMDVCIPTQLQYSCVFWAAHLYDTTANATTDDAGDRDVLLNEVSKFFYTNFLHWLEVMSFLEEVPVASVALLTAARGLAAFNPNLAEFAIEGYLFVVNFQTPISESAPHIYLSALPFSPRQSLIARQYLPQFSRTLSVVKGRAENWPAHINVLAGHSDSVMSVAFSPDGQFAASGSADCTSRVWNVQTGRTVAGPFRHLGKVWAVAYSPNGKKIATGSHKNSICIWDVASGRKTSGPVPGHGSFVWSVAFSPDGQQVASGSNDGTLTVWNVDTGRAFAGPFSGHMGGIESVAYSPDGRRVVSGSHDTTLRVWDIDAGETVVKPFQGHTSSVGGVAYSPDGKRIVSGSNDKTVYVWDAETGDIVRGPFKGHTGSVWSVAYSPDGKRVVSGSADKTIRVWDVETGDVVAGPFEGHRSLIWSVAYSPNGKRVISGSLDKTIRVWDVETGQIIAGLFKNDATDDTVPTTRETELSKALARLTEGSDGDQGSTRGKRPQAASVSNPRHKTAVASSRKRVTGAISSVFQSVYWKSTSSENLVGDANTEAGKVVVGLVGRKKSLASDASRLPDGMRNVPSSRDRPGVETRKTVTGLLARLTISSNLALSLASRKQAISVLEGDTVDGGSGKVDTDSSKFGPMGEVNSISCSPDGKRVVSCSGDKMVRVWDIATGQVVAGPFRRHLGAVLAVSFSPDGKQVASGSDDKMVCVWDAETGRITSGPFCGHQGSVSSVAFSPDGMYIVSGSHDSTSRVWDIRMGQIHSGPFRVHTKAVTSVACSPDGRVLSGSQDGTVYEWDIETGQISAGPLVGHQRGVETVAYSPDGKLVASGSEDTVLVWNIKTGQIAAHLLGCHTGSIHSVAFSPDGGHVVSGSHDSTICIWDIATGEIVGDPLRGHTASVRTVVYSPTGSRVVSASADGTIRVWNISTDACGSMFTDIGMFGQTRQRIPPDSTGTIATQKPSLTNSSRHLVALRALGGLNVIGSCRHPHSNGWAHDPESTSERPDILFWVPFEARDGLGDSETLSVLGVQRTELDLERFVHGQSWTFCRYLTKTPCLLSQAPASNDP